MLSCVIIIYLNKRELSYMWSERLLVSVGGMFVCDSHEGRVRFDAGSASLGSGERVSCGRGNDVRAFPRGLSEFLCAVRLKELLRKLPTTYTLDSSLIPRPLLRFNITRIENMGVVWG